MSKKAMMGADYWEQYIYQSPYEFEMEAFRSGVVVDRVKEKNIKEAFMKKTMPSLYKDFTKDSKCPKKN